MSKIPRRRRVPESTCLRLAVYSRSYSEELPILKSPDVKYKYNASKGTHVRGFLRVHFDGMKSVMLSS
jgi:hypothetical protein